MMAATIGHMEGFDESVEPWTTYIERFEHFVEANSIEADKKVPVLLSVIGGKTYGLLRRQTEREKLQAHHRHTTAALLSEAPGHRGAFSFPSAESGGEGVGDTICCSA